SADFNGSKVIGEATRVANAVEAIGGAARLTAAEKERVNAVLERAIDKYRALGQTAPKALTDLAAQTKQVETETSRWSKTTERLFALISVGALTKLASDVLDLAGKLTDLSGK